MEIRAHPIPHQPRPKIDKTGRVRPSKAGISWRRSPTKVLKQYGLRKPQLRILRALVAAGRPLTRREISAITGLDYCWMGTWIGATDPDRRADNDRRYSLKSLVTTGLVKLQEHDVDGRDTIYNQVTAAGKKLVRLLAEIPDERLTSS